MRKTVRLIFDTNILVSRLLVPTSLPAKAMRKGISSGQILVSDDTLLELHTVLSRKKFDKYVTLEERKKFFNMVGRLGEKIPIIKVVRECRDPKDDKFLELAVNGRADILVTGDQDLLEFGTFHGTRVLTAAEYLDE